MPRIWMRWPITYCIGIPPFPDPIHTIWCSPFIDPGWLLRSRQPIPLAGLFPPMEPIRLARLSPPTGPIRPIALGSFRCPDSGRGPPTWGRIFACPYVKIFLSYRKDRKSWQEGRTPPLIPRRWARMSRRRFRRLVWKAHSK